MRDDNRRGRFEDEDNLFSELRAELDAVDRNADAAPASLGPKAPPDSPAQNRPGAPTVAAYPPEGFDSDEALDRLPSFPSRTGRFRDASARAPGRRPSRFILGAVCLAVVGAVFLFWRPGGKPETPLGVGERTSTVTQGSARAPAEPVTEPVDIAAETRPLAAEQEAASADAGTPTVRTPSLVTPSSKRLVITPPQITSRTNPVKPIIQPNVGTSHSPAATGAGSHPVAPAASGTARATGAEPPRSFATDPATTPPPATAPESTAPSALADAAEAPPTTAVSTAATGAQPAADGAWALQLGAFSTQENADALAGKLRGQGLRPYLQAGSSSSGGLVFKVAIGYFATREAAVAYAQRNVRLLGPQALPVHR
jgi:cell division septation protein DedD